MEGSEETLRLEPETTGKESLYVVERRTSGAWTQQQKRYQSQINAKRFLKSILVRNISIAGQV